MSYLKRLATRAVPQTEPLQGQVPNSDVATAGRGRLTRLRRFLRPRLEAQLLRVEWKLTPRERAGGRALHATDGARAVRRSSP
jgi:hypothetical protein